MNWPDSEPGNVPESGERRANPRNAMLMTGKVYQRGCLTQCVISNVSVGGAKVLLPESATDQLPDPAEGSVVTLTVPRYGDFPARLVWARQTAIGVGFLQSPDEIAHHLAAYVTLGQTA